MRNTLIAVSICLMASAHAYESQIREKNFPTTLEAFVKKASLDTGVKFGTEDFLLVEETRLATSNFKMFVQMNSKVPIERTAIRLWTHPVTGELVLGEMHLNEEGQLQKESLRRKYLKGKFSDVALNSSALNFRVEFLVNKELQKYGKVKVIGRKSFDVWRGNDLVRKIEVRTKKGIYHIVVSLFKNDVIESSFEEFLKSDSHVANVYPMYEEVEATGERLKFEQRELRHLYTHIQDGGENPLRDMTGSSFPESKYFPLLVNTAQGREFGLWSEASIRKSIERIIQRLPSRKNNYKRGLLLKGKYALVSLHPDVKKAFPNTAFELTPSTGHILKWEVQNNEWFAKPISGYNGRPIFSGKELLARIPYRHPEHDTAKYINSGVDEVQVYYGVTTLMETLQSMGFTDPGIADKPFHAFLYDPDISMKDNAYYYDNTINFTTYSKNAPNYARDNPTIWHELGHGVMDRLMGPHLSFADTKGSYGGLSEGMADLVAQLIVEAETNGSDFPGKNLFRIKNETGFYLTNEFHDEGEAYGGAMDDMLQTAISLYGRNGLVEFADLTLESMRLTRNHPALTPALWFEHMIIADELGSSLRSAGKYSDLIRDALKSRNFAFERSFVPAQMKIMLKDMELTNISMGSRDRPFIRCGQDGVVKYNLRLSLTPGDADYIKFPATVKVEYQKGALQGAIRWAGEENNPEIYTINNSSEELLINLNASHTCEYSNQEDGSCKDYAYIQVFNSDSEKPVGKKRFYLKINEEDCK